jgi:uncharacterized coiled-coil protein SlyX
MSKTRIAFLERQNENLKQEVLGHCDAIDQLAAQLNAATARLEELDGADKGEGLAPDTGTDSSSDHPKH